MDKKWIDQDDIFDSKAQVMVDADMIVPRPVAVPVYLAPEVEDAIAALEKSHHDASMLLKAELIECHKAITRQAVELMKQDEKIRILLSRGE